MKKLSKEYREMIKKGFITLEDAERTENYINNLPGGS